MSGAGSPGWALVTGASSGIGAALARQLAARGVPLVLVARRTERLEALAAELRPRVPVEVLAQDLALPGAAQALHVAVQQIGVEVEFLVNNAGKGMLGRFLEMDLDEVAAMQQLNVVAPVQLTALFGRDMVRRGRGRILQVASAAAFLPSATVAAYAASKSDLAAFSEALSFELRASGVSVTTLYPGITRTEFHEVAGSATPWIMDLSILGAEEVARQGLAGMFSGRRAVVPGWINRINAVLCQVLPRGWVIGAAGWLMERANGLGPGSGGAHVRAR